MKRKKPSKKKIPNKVTKKTLEDTNKGKNLIKSKNVEELFKKLGF